MSTISPCISSSYHQNVSSAPNGSIYTNNKQDASKDKKSNPNLGDGHNWKVVKLSKNLLDNPKHPFLYKCSGCNREFNQPMNARLHFFCLGGIIFRKPRQP
jgi:hypothetical protein